ncbi:MAG: septum formation inhibitor Maf [Acidobacteria bacterium]|nr:MAG: septum formation inhibitor Maf [Acidobacteriota bacterium]
MRLILASASPRRRALLEAAGYEFEVIESGVDEAARPGEPAEALAARLAREKALRVAGLERLGTLVLGADTVVAVEGEILGKPADAQEARQMLRRLSGRTHQVFTGVCLARAPGRVVAEALEMTPVGFRELSDNDIENYIASDEPFDKAGGYGIQGLASSFVSRVEGSYSNVVGLPVERVVEMLRPFQESGHGAIG